MNRAAAFHLKDGAVVLVDPDTRDNAAKLAENGLRFLDGVEQLCKFAAEYLEAVGQQAEYADQQKLRVAALKLRLNKLAQERRRLDADTAQALAAKQAELARLTG